MITVIDYGMGNAGSILNMFSRLAADAELSSDPDRIAHARKLLLPGVGAFDDGVRNLRRLGLIEAIYHAVRKRRVPLLGICLGMQLLGESSEEGTLRGLALIPGRNERFRLSDRGLKVPHMSWNVAEVARSHSLFDGREETARYYFVHSYHFICDEPRHSLAHTVYGIRFNSAVESENVTGVQFHPEKSLRWGMEILRRFAQHV